jgi:flagellar biosynthesis protein FlhA
MSLTAMGTAPAANRGGKDIAFAVGIVLILCLFFLPVPAVMIDFGLALSIALSVLILMVGLWIQKPLEFSAFPTVLLVATILRLALNISTTDSSCRTASRDRRRPATSSAASPTW